MFKNTINSIESFLKKNNINKAFLITCIFVVFYTGFVHFQVNKKSKIYLISTKQEAKFKESEYTAFFICNFENQASIQNIKDIVQVSKNLDHEKLSFYYLFALKKLDSVYFGAAESIIARNKISEENALYLDLEEKNNFLDKYDIDNFPTLIIFDKNKKIVYKYVGWNYVANISNDINNIINK